MPVLKISDRQAERLRSACVEDDVAALPPIAEVIKAVLEAGYSDWSRPRPQPDSAPTKVILNWLRSTV